MTIQEQLEAAEVASVAIVTRRTSSPVTEDHWEAYSVGRTFPLSATIADILRWASGDQLRRGYDRLHIGELIFPAQVYAAADLRQYEVSDDQH